MVKRHLKRINSPKTWPITRKETVFVIRPRPSGHPMKASMPVSILLQDVLGIAGTARAVRFILANQEVLVSGRRVRKPEESAGLMDVVSFPATKTTFRILISEKNKLYAVPVAGDETKLVPSKVTSKTAVAGSKVQLGFHNGRSLLVEKGSYKVGDTAVLSLDGKVAAHYALAPGAFCLVSGGKHVGKTGTVESVEGSKVAIKTADGGLTTEKTHVFVLGHDAPAIKLK